MPNRRPLAPATPEYLPLSYLNQFCYCPRRFWYMFVLGEMEENAAVLEGTLRHGRPDRPGMERSGQQLTHRSVWVHSDRLRLVGLADLVEESDGLLVVVEYKRGKQGRWRNDRVQLCAQALCLEETVGSRDDRRVAGHGEIFYWRSRRRIRVEFSRALRTETEKTVAQAFAALAAGTIPPHSEQRARCRGCSLEPICLPAEVALLQRTCAEAPTRRAG